VPEWRTPELDEAASQALALVTLYATGTGTDAALAHRLLDQFAAGPDGLPAVVGGLVSICASLLVLLEFDTGVPPETSLRRVGQLVAQASVLPASHAGRPGGAAGPSPDPPPRRVAAERSRPG
jgi:hypothetical protein